MGNRGSKGIPHLLTKMCIHDDRYKYKGIHSRDIMIIHGDSSSMYMYLIDDTTLPVDKPGNIYDYVVANGIVASRECRYLIDGNVLMLCVDDRVLIAARLPFMSHVSLTPRSGGISICGIPGMVVPPYVMDRIYDWISRWPLK